MEQIGVAVAMDQIGVVVAVGFGPPDAAVLRRAAVDQGVDCDVEVIAAPGCIAPSGHRDDAQALDLQPLANSAENRDWKGGGELRPCVRLALWGL